ncbi:unnamed protein product [Phytophthora lilii]|uniref:Unnamed protein product n=1 Tax=Phytophthora lilii TaxID=2077276 RepID=A0A9W6U8Q6_9STRA|nr:unnamed protein product [Phytophthora lilii]
MNTYTRRAQTCQNTVVGGLIPWPHGAALAACTAASVSPIPDLKAHHCMLSWVSLLKHFVRPKVYNTSLSSLRTYEFDASNAAIRRSAPSRINVLVYSTVVSFAVLLSLIIKITDQDPSVGGPHSSEALMPKRLPLQFRQDYRSSQPSTNSSTIRQCEG